MVEATQTECCYVEGSTDVLEITNRTGFGGTGVCQQGAALGWSVLSRFERVPVGLGPHTVMLWQEVAVGAAHGSKVATTPS